MLPTTFEEEPWDCVPEQEVKRIPGSTKIIMISIAVFVYSLLGDTPTFSVRVAR